MVKAVFVKCSVTSENKNTSQKFLPSNILFHACLQKQHRLNIKLFLKIYSLLACYWINWLFQLKCLAKVFKFSFFCNIFVIRHMHILSLLATAYDFLTRVQYKYCCNFLTLSKSRYCTSSVKALVILLQWNKSQPFISLGSNFSLFSSLYKEPCQTRKRIHHWWDDNFQVYLQILLLKSI